MHRLERGSEESDLLFGASIGLGEVGLERLDDVTIGFCNRSRDSIDKCRIADLATLFSHLVTYVEHLIEMRGHVAVVGALEAVKLCLSYGLHRVGDDIVVAI